MAIKQIEQTGRISFSPEQQRDFAIQLFAGGMAGAVSRTIVSPLERMKILFQVQGTGDAKYQGVMPTLRKVYREEGWVGYFKGNGTNCIRIAPYSAIQFAVYEQIKWYMVGKDQLSTKQRLCAGAVAGIASVFFTYPLDIARTRLSVMGDSSMGILGVIRYIYQNEGGLLGLYRGLSPTTMGVAPYVAFNFAVYEGLKFYIINNDVKHKEPSVVTRLAIGGIAGTVAQTITYPLDLIRRRFQVMSMQKNGYGYQYSSTFNALTSIVRAEGIAGLYKGCLPNYLKVAPAISVQVVKWSSDGRRLASGSKDNTCKLWTIDLQTGAYKKTIELHGHSKSIEQLAWNPQNVDVVCTASVDKTVKIWDAKTGKCEQSIDTLGENISVNYHPEGNYLSVGNKADEICIYDVRTWNIIRQHKFDFEVNECCWNPGGNFFFLTTGQGNVEMRSFPDFELVNLIRGHTANCYCLTFDPTGKYLAIGSADAITSLWDTRELLCEKTFEKLDWPVRTVCFSFDGKYIATGSEDLFIDISNVDTGESVYQIKCNAATNCVSWNPKHYLLSFAGDECDKYNREEGNIRIFGFS